MNELTIRSLILGILLAIVLGAANTYLGLYAGMTVSASIPAAVISMAILRGLFRSGTIRENNIVQSVASAGESLAAGVIFTVPALLLVGAWHEFEFWPTTMIALFGGGLGVIFMIPLRRALIVERKDLIYPEGVACAEVLQAGEEGGSGIRAIMAGAGTGAVLKILSAWVMMIRGTVEGAFAFAGSRVAYFGLDVSAALAGVGYIVKFNIAVLIFLGGAIAWLLFLPISGIYDAGGAVAPIDYAWSFWNAKIRYVGVGAMLIGAIESLWAVRKGVAGSLMNIGASLKNDDENRTDRDIALWHLGVLLLAAFFGTVYLYDFILNETGHDIPASAPWIVAVVMILAAFLFVALASYIVGLVGSSNSPVSGMTICALLLTSGVVLALGLQSEDSALAILGVAGVVCCATCTSGDISQDLKTGYLVRATPYKQQWAELAGVVAAAPIFAYVLTLLNDAYGIGTGEPGALKAPQAALFAGITRALVGEGELPYDMVAAGALIGVAFLAINPFLKRTGTDFRFHIMPIAVGIYLPLSLSVAILIGGVLRLVVDRMRAREGDGEVSEGRDGGVLFASGLIAGESLAGIAIAILIAQSLAGAPEFLQWKSNLLGIAVFGGVLWLFYRYARGR